MKLTSDTGVTVLHEDWKGSQFDLVNPNPFARTQSDRSICPRGCSVNPKARCVSTMHMPAWLPMKGGQGGGRRWWSCVVVCVVVGVLRSAWHTTAQRMCALEHLKPADRGNRTAAAPPPR